MVTLGEGCINSVNIGQCRATQQTSFSLANSKMEVFFTVYRTRSIVHAIRVSHEANF